MRTTEICPLTEKALVKLLVNRKADDYETSLHDRRQAPRYLFFGVAELWIPNEQGCEQLIPATSLNLSQTGIGVRCDEWLAPGLELAIAFHGPKVCFHARAVVRHGINRGDNNYQIGLQFVFDDK